MFEYKIPPDHFTDVAVFTLMDRHLDGASCDSTAECEVGEGTYFLSLGLLLKGRRTMSRYIKSFPAKAEKLVLKELLITEPTMAPIIASDFQLRRSLEGGEGHCKLMEQFKRYEANHELPSTLKIALGVLIKILLRKLVHIDFLESLEKQWNYEQIETISYELSRKSITLNAKLNRDLDGHPWYPPSSDENLSVHFDRIFLQKVHAFHCSVERPQGTFRSADTVDEEDTIVERLLSSPRDICPKCGRRRQIYCGACHGFRMPNVEEILPPRISLPFRVLILLHWQESLQKCTGVHASVLCSKREVDIVEWSRPEGFNEREIQKSWGPTIESLDPARDVILFPEKETLSADQFNWWEQNGQTESNVKSEEEDVNVDMHHIEEKGEDSTAGDVDGRYRLVVLEANWTNGNTMYKQLKEHREAKGLAPIRCIKLQNVVGKYWRFHTMGNSAVSTIEAIAHTAMAAGATEQDAHILTTLFRTQRVRVFRNKSNQGKPPRAAAVCGSGLGDWSTLAEEGYCAE